MSLHDKFESTLSGLSGDSLAKYRRSISSLELFMLGHGLSLADLTPASVADWVYDLMTQGRTRSAIVRNLNVLSSVLRDNTEANLVDTAKSARALARTIEKTAEPIPPLLHEKTFAAALARLRAWIKGDGTSPARDLLLVSILGGCTPVGELARLRKDQIGQYAGKAKEILERNAAATRDYVFALDQSHRTPRQLIRAMAADLTADLMAGLDLPADLDPDALTASLWAAMAMRCGTTAGEALGCVGAAPLATTPIVPVTPGDGIGRADWQKAVASMLTRGTARWYAMHLRRGVTFDQLQTELATRRPAPTLFYPCRQITRNQRNRKIIEQQPLINSTVFFRTAPEAVTLIFRQIGDKAWCYRHTGVPGAPYAVIPDYEMQRFQAAVGQFTPDTDIHPLGTLELRPDDRVILLLAPYAGQQATVTRQLTGPEGRTIYRVAFTATTGIEWTLDADPRQLQQIENS